MMSLMRHSLCFNVFSLISVAYPFRFFLNLLAAPLEPLSADVDKVQSYLLDTRFLTATNHTTVATAIIECFHNSFISYEYLV